ncbi:MAG: multidrug transporter [Caldimonas sp.]|uniref:efflux RND transporter periplasmic adaptor subunit n=1 Tax=Caldimonas taiwanensis TaxID=307483 RepID=UPI0007840A69|nr:efflux RND transporter periplasmic adaptor subunit [Caldimonas taiwanensis]GIX25051.1 MAG: multidrug transporter [Caldimonas sp.]
MPQPTLVSAVILALVSLVLTGCTRTPPPQEPVRAVRTLTLAASSARQQQEYAAEVRARTESRLGFRVPGKMVQRHVNLGDKVRAGQVLAVLDARDLRLGEQAARAAVSAAQANLEQAEADFRRFSELRAQGFISSSELERRETALKAARAQWAQAQAQANVQGNQAAYANLVADVSGVVTAIEAEPGMVLGAGMAVLRLAHDGPRDAVFAVPEDQLEAVRALAAAGVPVQVRLWGQEGRSIEARIREVAAAADPITRTYTVKADLGLTDVPLGRTATVVIQQPAQAGVAKLPLSALREHQGRTHVWVVDPDTMAVNLHPVELAGSDGNEVVVRSGLKPGQTIVTAGVHVLTPGQRVRIYREGTTPAAPASAPGALETASRSAP